MTSDRAADDWTRDDLTPDDINALLHTFDMGLAGNGNPIEGWLSTLVWNTRNNYLSLPECTFSAEQVRTLVEGFMGEVARLRAGETSPSRSCYRKAPKSSDLGPDV